MRDIESKKRIDEARAEAHELLDSMFDHMEDAERGNLKPEYYRADSAHQATACFWSIYELGLVWAEDFARGVYRIENHPVIARLVEPLRSLNQHDDTWIFEEVGRVLQVRDSDQTVVQSSEVTSALDAASDFFMAYGPDWTEMQTVIYEMTRSRLTDSAWRDKVHSHIFHVLVGENADLFQPQSGKHGSATALFRAKLAIIREVAFRYGAGASKTEARSTIGGIVGVSEHTLKKWESELKRIGEVDFAIHCAQWAGLLDRTISESEPKQNLDAVLADDEIFHVMHYGYTLAYVIRAETRMRQNTTDEQLRLNLRQARSGDRKG
jgi:hypothetical protein